MNKAKQASKMVLLIFSFLYRATNLIDNQKAIAVRIVVNKNPAKRGSSID